MSEEKKTMLKIAVLFAVSGATVNFLTQQAGACHESALPFPLLSTLVVGLLLICTVFMMHSCMEHHGQVVQGLKDDLERLNKELESTKISQEEKVERRTFEISVANAALNREIAERMQTEAEMTRIKHQMELILEFAGEGIFGINAQGNVDFVNRAACLMLGWEADELIGKSHHEMVHHTKANGEHYPIQECPISQAFQDGIVHFGSDEVFWSKDGNSFPVEYTSTPIMKNGTLTGAVVVFRDISTRGEVKAGSAQHKNK
jgi:PAS domain S-box-containing protein